MLGEAVLAVVVHVCKNCLYLFFAGIYSWFLYCFSGIFCCVKFFMCHSVVEKVFVITNVVVVVGFLCLSVVLSG